MKCSPSDDVGPDLNNEFNNNTAVITQSNHLHFGLSLAKRFLDSKERTRKTLTGRQKLNLHNNKVGRQVIMYKGIILQY